jgi:hypothetical protein
MHKESYTLPEAIKILDRPIPVWLGADASSQGSSALRDKWAGATWKDARRMAERGDPETLRRFDDAARLLTIQDKGTARKKVKRRTVAGGAVDLGAYLAGAPDCMIDRISAEAPRKVVTIGVRINAPSHVKPEEMAERGAAIGSIVHLLTLRGYSVGIDALFAAEKRDRFLISVTLKAPGEHLDPSVVAFWLGSPATLRRIGFRLSEELPEKIARRCGVGDDYGMSNFEIETGHDVYIPRGTPGKTGKEYFEEFRDLFAKAGISIDGETDRA